MIKYLFFILIYFSSFFEYNFQNSTVADYNYQLNSPDTTSLEYSLDQKYEGKQINNPSERIRDIIVI